MRVLHTSDWHLGRQLEGRSRLDEQVAVLAEIAALVREARVDLIVVAGDVFDTVNPSAEAERLFYESLDSLSEGGRRGVLCIAGNHDNPERLAAASPLAARQGVALLGRPGRPPALADAVDGAVRWRPLPGGAVEASLPGARGQAVVAALPYPSEARLAEALAEGLDEGTLQSAYSDRVAALFAQAARDFRRDTVNLATSHLFVLGGYESDSERPIQVGGAYTVAPSALPSGAQYVALGHLHRAQTVAGLTNARYSGSPLAYSFSEAYQTKSVTIVDAVAGEEGARVEEVALTSGRPLVRWQALDGLAQALLWAQDGRDPGAWIDLELHLGEALALDQIRRLRELRPGIVQIRPVMAAPGEGPAPAERSRMAAGELFQAFYRSQRGAPPPPATVALFLELLADAEGQSVDVSPLVAAAGEDTREASA